MKPELTFLSIFSSLFFIFNATGQIPLFLALLAKFSQKRQYQIIIREFLIALIIVLLFVFFGDQILSAIGISKEIMSMAGGIVLFIISLGMIFPKEAEKSEKLTQEPMIVPFAIPLIAGPGIMTATMLYSHDTGRPLLVAAATGLAWTLSLAIILAGSLIKKLLGEKGLIAIERLGGMLLCLIGIQMLAVGFLELARNILYS